MGFFFVSQDKKTDKNLKGISPDFLRRHECQVCPLDKERDLQHPKMPATGSKSPVVYMLGGGPGAAEDSKGIQFVGPSGRLVRNRVPEEWKDKVRWNNAVNCSPPERRDPESIELACCRPRLERDIALTKPQSIFGFGAIPMHQILKPDSKYSKISLWRGRRIPVIVGGHACWYYPMFHPMFILGKRKFSPRDLNSYGSEEEFAFALDLQRAFAEQKSLPEPIIHTQEDALGGIELVYDIKRIAELLNIVANDPSTGVDLETNGIRPYKTGAKILTMGFASKSATFAFPVDHPQANWSVLERKQLDVLIRRFLYEANCRKIVHHLSFELEWFGFFYGTGCFYAGRWEDSESQAYLLDARRGSLSLDFLCLQHFGIKLKEISGLDRANLEKAPVDKVLKYNASDSRYHRLLYLTLLKRIKQEGLVEQYEHQLRRIPSLTLAQMEGMPVDQTIVRKYKKKYEGKAAIALEAIQQEEVVKEFERKKGKQFNPASALDVNYLLKNIVGVEISSTDKTELSHVEHPIAKKIVEFREPMKVLSTYILPLDIKSEENNVYPDGKIHPNFSTTTVVTWRTSSSEPNCMHPDIELLTPQGWQKISEWEPKTPIMQWWSDGVLSWEEKAFKIERDTDESLVWFEEPFVKGGFTSDHRMVSVASYDGRIREKTAGWVLEHSRLDGIPIAGKLQQKESLSVEQVRLLVALAADGSSSSNGKAWRWGFKKKRKIERLRCLLCSVGITFTETVNSGITTFYVSKKERENNPWLVKGFSKWILTLGPEALLALVDELVHWDGFSNSRNGQTTFCTSEYEQALWVQTAGHLINRPCTVKSYYKKTAYGKSITWYVYFRKSSYSSIGKPTSIPYKGKTYCPSVASSYVLVRYNGGIFVTGQCQNYPKRDEERKEVREPIKSSDPDVVVVSIDYAGIQARNVAMESKDKRLVDAYWHNYDIHTTWMERIIKKYPKWVPKSKLNDKEAMKGFRYRAKNQFVFPSFFGAQAFKISEGLGIPQDLCEELREEFFDEFNGIDKWHTELKKFYYANGYVTGLSGFRRRAPVSINELINSPIQSDESIIVMDAMNRLSEMEDPRYQPAIMIHDDLTFFWPKKEVEKRLEVVIKELINVPFEWANIVPIEVEASWGPDWIHLTEIGKFANNQWNGIVQIRE